jgi:hypothetical protein
MNHNPSDDSAKNLTPSDRAVVAGTDTESAQKRSALNPLLQKALSCLDIKLEDELTRFRAKQQTDPIDTEADRQESDGGRHRPELQANPVIWEQQSMFDGEADILTAEILNPAPPEADIQPGAQDRDPAPVGGFIIIDGLTSSASSSRNAIANTNYAPIELHRSGGAVDRQMALNFSAGGQMTPYHDEYSSSSQELLRQIQSGRPPSEPATSNNADVKAAPAPRPKHLTPLKIGSVAAACALAGGAVYTYLNPSILAPLTATKTVSPTTTSLLGQTIQSPNLAANEFSELNLSTLNTIKLPTVATATTTAPTTTTTTMTAPANSSAGAPAAIPFDRLTQAAPIATISSQPRLADSLVRSLLPPNFHTFVKPAGYRVTPPVTGR